MVTSPQKQVSKRIQKLVEELEQFINHEKKYGNLHNLSKDKLEIFFTKARIVINEISEQDEGLFKSVNQIFRAIIEATCKNENNSFEQLQTKGLMERMSIIITNIPTYRRGVFLITALYNKLVEKFPATHIWVNLICIC